MDGKATKGAQTTLTGAGRAAASTPSRLITLTQPLARLATPADCRRLCIRAVQLLRATRTPTTVDLLVRECGFELSPLAETELRAHKCLAVADGFASFVTPWPHITNETTFLRHLYAHGIFSRCPRRDPLPYLDFEHNATKLEADGLICCVESGADGETDPARMRRVYYPCPDPFDGLLPETIPDLVVSDAKIRPAAACALRQLWRRVKMSQDAIDREFPPSAVPSRRAWLADPTQKPRRRAAGRRALTNAHLVGTGIAFVDALAAGRSAATTDRGAVMAAAASSERRNKRAKR